MSIQTDRLVTTLRRLGRQCDRLHVLIRTVPIPDHAQPHMDRLRHGLITIKRTAAYLIKQLSK